MSWGFTFQTDRPTLKHDADRACEAYVAGLPESAQTSQERDDQYVAAVRAAAAILEDEEGGPVGDGPYSVSLTGHANPGHRKQQGWANDIVTVSVAQL